MTQEVQPLAWQKRTNLEEHQQFFAKINEIIANLAPTVNEAEAAIAQATQAIASADSAVATANAASAAASAAASQAQTAASTVAGYDTRLTAAEGDIDALQAADQTITGNVAALGTRMTAAESKNTQQDTAIAAVQTKNNQQDAAIGALQTADAQNVKISRINEYAVGLTSDQDFYGIKNAKTGIEGKIYFRGINTATAADNAWAKAFSVTLDNNQVIMADIVSAFNNADTQNATVKIYRRDDDNSLGCVVLDSCGTIAAMASAANYVAVLDDGVMTLYTKKIRRYTNLRARVWWMGSYGGMIDLPNITWLNEAAVDPSTETHERIAIGTPITNRNVA